MGKSRGSAPQAGAEESAEARRLAGIQADIAQGIFNESSPLRQESFGLLNKALDRVGQPISVDALAANPQFGALKAATEQQFDLARDRTLENLPRGGVLESALGNIEGARAGALTSGFGALAADELQTRERNLDRGLSISTGVPAISLGGLSSAGSTFTNLAGQQAAIAQSQAQANAQKASSTGQGVGFVLGSAVGGPAGGKAGSAVGGK